MSDTNALIKGIIETQIIEALNSGPDLIEKLVKAALAQPVDKHGNPEGSRNYSGAYGAKTMPYIDWMVGEEIRSAAQAAARKVVQESVGIIEAEVRKGLSSDTIVAAVTKSFVKAAEQDWRINVSFESKDK